MCWNLIKEKNGISKIRFLECDRVIGVCGYICKMLNQSITSAIQYDNQSMQWENQFYQLIELNRCLWTHANQRLSVASHTTMVAASLSPWWVRFLPRRNSHKRGAQLFHVFLSSPGICHWPMRHLLGSTKYISWPTSTHGQVEQIGLLWWVSWLPCSFLLCRTQAWFWPCYKSVLPIFHKLTVRIASI